MYVYFFLDGLHYPFLLQLEKGATNREGSKNYNIANFRQPFVSSLYVLLDIILVEINLHVPTAQNPTIPSYSWHITLIYTKSTKFAFA